MVLDTEHSSERVESMWFSSVNVTALASHPLRNSISLVTGRSNRIDMTAQLKGVIAALKHRGDDFRLH